MMPLRKTSIYLTLLIVLAVAAGRSPGASAPPAASAAPATAYPDIASPVSQSVQPAARARYTNGFIFQSAHGSATEPVLVIPGKEVDSETVGSVIEDLSVMARIIERNSSRVIGSADMGPMNLLGRLRFGGQDTGPATLFSSAGRPKPLYVAGYGALFFIQVDYPLLAPPEAKDQPPATEPGDAVWAETRRSIFEPGTPGIFQPGDTKAPEPYSRERVDMLKSTLIATMRHATNIRGLEPGEWLTIVVQGTSPEADSPARGPAPRQVGQLASRAPDGKSVLTLRATKADVDLYAKGELSQTQFEQRLQVVVY